MDDYLSALWKWCHFCFKTNHFFFSCWNIDTCAINDKLRAKWLNNREKKTNCQQKLTACREIVYPNNSSRKLQKFAPTIFMTFSTLAFVLFIFIFIATTHAITNHQPRVSKINNFMEYFLSNEAKWNEIVKLNWKQLFSFFLKKLRSIFTAHTYTLHSSQQIGSNKNLV